ncbi:MAG: dipeptidase [Planctomycetes bacterium]|nr:dipeptidase [Planctomycetota bacterium]
MPGIILFLALFGLICLLTTRGFSEGEDPAVEDDAELEALSRRIHAEAIVIDTHSDTPIRMSDPDWDFMDCHEDGHMDLPRIRKGGLDAVFLVVYMSKQKPEEPGIAVKKALVQIDRIRLLVEKNPRELELAVDAADIRRCAARGKTAILIGIEGGHIIDGRLEVLRCYHRLGARYMTLTHSFHHEWADSSGIHTPLGPGLGGLSPFGHEVVQEMNRLGMMVDVSHISDDAFWAVYETSKAPLIATHSGVRVLSDHPRNLSDEMIQAMAGRGGVVQVVFYPAFLDPDFRTKREQAERKRERKETAIRKENAHRPDLIDQLLGNLSEEIPIENTPVSVLIDHIEHIARLVGADHVGLGADWDGVGFLVEGLEDCSKVPRITFELLKRGFSEKEIKKILGENVLRVMEEVERCAKGA